MLSTHCETCRFQEQGSCTKGICAVVRCHLRGQGIKFPYCPTFILAPERVTPEGIKGFAVADIDYPPTVDGYIGARGREGQTGAQLEVRRR